MSVDYSLPERAAALEAAKAARNNTVATPSGGDGGGPHDSAMETRVRALEGDAKEIKASLSRVEVSTARCETNLSMVANKSDIVAIGGRMDVFGAQIIAQTDRLVAVEQSVVTTIATALSRTLGASSIVGLVAGIATVGVVAVGAIAWTLQHLHMAQ